MVDSDGSQLGVISREEALDVAKERELDLVLVSEKADPPVCRIMDYGKFKFEQEKKAKEAKKSRTRPKSRRSRCGTRSISTITCGSARPALPQGGRQGEVHRDLPWPRDQHRLAETLLRRMAKDLEEKAEIQQAPKREGRNMIMFLTPRKTPLVKKEEKEQSPTKAVRTIPHRRGQRPPRWRPSKPAESSLQQQLPSQG